MTEVAVTTQLVLDKVLEIRSDLRQMSADLQELKQCMASLEVSVQGLRRDIAALRDNDAAYFATSGTPSRLQ